MLDELDFPNGIALCSECHVPFHIPSETQESGRCKVCHGVLCPGGYAAAVRERRGVCYACSNPQEPEWEPEKPRLPEPSLFCPRGHAMVRPNIYDWMGVTRCRACRNIDRKERDQSYRKEADAKYQAKSREKRRETRRKK